MVVFTHVTDELITAAVASVETVLRDAKDRNQLVQVTLERGVREVTTDDMQVQAFDIGTGVRILVEVQALDPQERMLSERQRERRRSR